MFSPTRPPEELFDVEKDPFETINLAKDARHAETLGQLRARLDQWSRDTKDPAPESAEIYELEMKDQIKRTKSSDEKAAMEQNITLMKKWATERPLQTRLP